VWLNTEHIDTFQAIQAGQGKSQTWFCLHEFAGAHDIVPSVPNILVENWPSTIQATQRAVLEQPQIKARF
jgi:hypothetical protein